MDKVACGRVDTHEAGLSNAYTLSSPCPPPRRFRSASALRPTPGALRGGFCEYDVRFSLVPNMSGWRGSINGEQLGSRGSRGSNSGVSSRWETSLAATESSRARRRKVAVERTASAVATRPPPPALCGECGISGSSPLGVGPRRAVSPAPRGRARTRPGSGVRGAPTPASACTARSRSLCRRGRGLPYDTHTTHIQSRRSGLGKRTAEPSRQPSVAHETGSDFGERTGEPQQRQPSGPLRTGARARAGHWPGPVGEREREAPLALERPYFTYD